jgi:hypothetical protein
MRRVWKGCLRDLILGEKMEKQQIFDQTFLHFSRKTEKNQIFAKIPQ